MTNSTAGTGARRILAIGAAAVLAVTAVILAPSPARAQVAPAPSTTPFGVADWDRDGHQDLIARVNATGDLYLYPGQSVRGYSSAAPVKIGNGWTGWIPYGVADWDRDGYQDIIARNPTTGDLWLYPGQGTRGYSYAAPVKLFTVAQFPAAYAPFGGLADWNKDGLPDIVTRHPNGYVYLWQGDGLRHPQPGYTMTAIFYWSSGLNLTSFGVIDWQRDGFADLIVRDNRTGNLFLYLGTGSLSANPNPPAYLIGNGWNGYAPFGLGDWDRDGHQDIVTRNDTTTALWLYPGQSVADYSQFPPVRIGSGF